jgi:hypothetical protein
MGLSAGRDRAGSSAFGKMASKIDYYALLSRAVAGLDRDAYAARGAVYDREHKALIRRMTTADAPAPEDAIERERRAFRAAVRRIEFGDEQIEIPLVPQRESLEEDSLPAAELRSGGRSDLQTRPAASPREPRPAPIPPPPAGEGLGGARSLRPPGEGPRGPRTAALDPFVDSSPAADEPAAPAVSLDTPPAAVALLKRRPITGRVFRRAILGVALLGLGAIAYAWSSGDIGLPFGQPAADKEAEAAGSAPVPTVQAARSGTPQVILFDGNRPDPNAMQFPGTATWKLRFEPGSSSQRSSAAVMLDLAVPGRKIVLTATMRREPVSSAMSHLFEFRFLGDNNEPDPDIVNIASVFMTTAEMARPDLLVGQVVSVTPGVFLFGLSGEASVRERNLRNLTQLGWMGIPIAYRNGASGLLVIEKGADGERAFNEALGQSGP